MKRHFETFAAYNAWANCRIYDAAARMEPGDFRADRGAFFGSVHRTLNHILVADRIWLNRFTGEGESYPRLDLVLYDDLDDLRRAREAEDRRILDWVADLAEEELAGTFTYHRVSTPEAITQELAPALAHFFNHQTHHRGQVHALMTAIGGRDAAPELDLLFFQREQAAR